MTRFYTNTFNRQSNKVIQAKRKDDPSIQEANKDAAIDKVGLLKRLDGLSPSRREDEEADQRQRNRALARAFSRGNL